MVLWTKLIDVEFSFGFLKFIILSINTLTYRSFPKICFMLLKLRFPGNFTVKLCKTYFIELLWVSLYPQGTPLTFP